MLALHGCVDRRPEQDGRIATAVPVERLSVALLWQDFHENRAQAERTYIGNAVVITGDVTRAGSGTPGERFVYFARTEEGGVHATLLDEQAEGILAAVKESPRVVLKCFCEGLTTDIILTSCIAAE
jgi:hypothetical protein